MLCCVVLRCVVLCCVVLCCVVLCCLVLCCVVLSCLVLCRRRCYKKAMAGMSTKRLQVNGRAVCLSACCVLVCCCTAGTCALSHLAGTVLPTPVHGRTGSKGPTAPCVLCCTISTLCAVPHCLVLCSALHCVCLAALHCVCLAALHLWAVGSGQWNSCNALPHCLGAVGSATPAIHCLTA